VRPVPSVHVARHTEIRGLITMALLYDPVLWVILLTVITFAIVLVIRIANVIMLMAAGVIRIIAWAIRKSHHTPRSGD
jgi:hypothetical protein